MWQWLRRVNHFRKLAGCWLAPGHNQPSYSRGMRPAFRFGSCSELLYLHSGTGCRRQKQVRWDSPQLAIPWPLPPTEMSERDRSLPSCPQPLRNHPMTRLSHCGSPLTNTVIDLGHQPPAMLILMLSSCIGELPTRCRYVCTCCWLVQLPTHASAEGLFTAEYVFFSIY